MLCYLIHEESVGCSQDIPPGSAWKFCPRCGRSTGHLRDLQKADLTFTIPYNKAETREFTLRAAREAETEVNAYLRLESSQAQLTSFANIPAPVSARRPQTITVRVNAIRQSGDIGNLFVETDDAPLLPDGDPWQPRSLHKRRPIPLRVEVQTPAKPQVRQQCAVFRQGVSERVLVVENQGSVATDVTQVVCPAGYEVSPTSASLPGNGHEIFKVRKVGAGAQPRSELTFRYADGSEQRVALIHITQVQTRELPRAIIGIDFGTAFTSVSFRKCEYRKDAMGRDVPDKVEFLNEPSDYGTENKRFPTRIWIGHDGEFAYASGATEMVIGRPEAGYLFREIKTLLRNPDDAYVHPEVIEGLPTHTIAIEDMQRRFGENWPQKLVIEYLKWLHRSVIQRELKARFGDPVSVKYVFSVPVLDYATPNQTLYLQQTSKMRQCIERAGFPMEYVEFQFEPVCASLGLLHPLPDRGWPRLGGKEHPILAGETIAVFDSGGGTTDVVLARAEFQGQAGELSLRVERCLGVGSKVETFGGELVTTLMQEAFRNPGSVRGTGDWFVGSINEDALLDPDEDYLRVGYVNDLERRDEAERLKTEIAERGTVTRGEQGRDTTISGSLLERLVLPYLQSLKEELNQAVFTADVSEDEGSGDGPARSRESTRYYICVGGNTYLPTVEKWVSMFMKDSDPEMGDRRLQIPGEDRKLAVAYGAAWVPFARIPNAVLYDIALCLNDKPLLTLKRNTSHEMINKPYLYEFEARDSKTVQVLYQNEADMPVCVLEVGVIENPYEVSALVDMWVDVQSGRIRVEYQVSAQAPLTSNDDTLPPPDPRKTLLTYPL